MSSEVDWETRVFSLITPDCIRRQLARQLLEQFRTLGLVPIAWRRVTVTGAQVDGVAAAQRAGAGQAFRYRALDALFALGPGIALCLADEQGSTGTELYEKVRTRKGKALPDDNPPDSIRYKLRAINTILSLVHISDNPVNAGKETAVLLDDDESWLDTALLDGYLRVTECTAAPESRGWVDVVAALRGRIIAYLWTTLTPHGRSLADDLIRTDELAEPKAGASLAAELTAPSALAPILAAPFDGAGPPLDMTNVRRCLKLHGLPLDDWEYTVLTSSMYFAPLRYPVSDA